VGQRVIKFCDVDANHEATDNVAVALDGEAVELDACDACAKKIRDGVARLMKPGRPLALRDLLKQANGNGEFNPQIVRSWAQRQGMPVADKGRVGEDIVAAWKAAGSPVQ
jgi:hypothetical protein